MRGNVSITQTQAPHRLGGLSLVSEVKGAEALAAINQLHGQEIDVINGYLADYRAAGAQARLWVAIASDGAAAEALTKRMTEKIGEGNSLFTGLTSLSVDGRKVYSAVGGGQRHYYFLAGDKVVWLSVGGTDPDPILKTTLDIYR